MEIKQWVWWAQSLESMAILYKAQKRHASTCTTLEAIGHLVYELRLKTHIWWTFKKGWIKCIIGEAGGVVGSTPEGMGCHIL